MEKFLLYGDIEDEILDTASYTDDGMPLLIRRQDLICAKEFLTKGINIAVISDFGNGKSVFLKILKSQLSQKGFPVYSVDNLDIYNREDLEVLAKANTRTYVFIDSYDQHLDFLQHFSDLNPHNLVLILASRTSNHERVRPKLRKYGINYNEIPIDELTENEVVRFVEIIDNIGFWGAQATLSSNEKINKIQHQNRGHIQQVLLSILQAPQMVSRVSEILKQLISTNSGKKTVFAISLLSALDYPLHSSLISEVAGCNDIYDSEFRGLESFKILFRIEGTRVVSRSSIFSISLIKNNFEPIYVVNQLLEIVERFKDYEAANSQEHELVKRLLRFSSVERLFPENHRINNLVRYYESVKKSLKWLTKDPHYWLQYGMALITYDNHKSAQRMLDQAYEFAEKKLNYHTVHIDMQQSRLLLKISAAEINPVESHKCFKNSIDFFNKVPDDYQKFRRVDDIFNVFSQRFTSYSAAHKNHFIITCENILKRLNTFLMSGLEQDGKIRNLESTRAKLEDLIFKGKEQS